MACEILRSRQAWSSASEKFVTFAQAIIRIILLVAYGARSSLLQNRLKLWRLRQQQCCTMHFERSQADLLDLSAQLSGRFYCSLFHLEGLHIYKPGDRTKLDKVHGDTTVQTKIQDRVWGFDADSLCAVYLASNAVHLFKGKEYEWRQLTVAEMYQQVYQQFIHDPGQRLKALSLIG